MEIPATFPFFDIHISLVLVFVDVANVSESIDEICSVAFLISNRIPNCDRFCGGGDTEKEPMYAPIVYPDINFWDG